jgi:hypothetical protein
MSFEPDSVVDLQKLRADVDSATEKLVSMRDFDTSPSFFGEVPKKREIKLKDIAKHLFAEENTKKVFSTASMTYNRHIRVWTFCSKLGSILCSSPLEAGQVDDETDDGNHHYSTTCLSLVSFELRSTPRCAQKLTG